MALNESLWMAGKSLKDVSEEQHGVPPIWISIFGILVKLVQVFLFVTEISKRHGLAGMIKGLHQQREVDPSAMVHVAERFSKRMGSVILFRQTGLSAPSFDEFCKMGSGKRLGMRWLFIGPHE